MTAPHTLHTLRDLQMCQPFVKSRCLASRVLLLLLLMLIRFFDLTEGLCPQTYRNICGPAKTNNDTYLSGDEVRSLEEIIVALDWTSVSLIHDTDGLQTVEALVPRLHSRAVFTTVYGDLGSFLNVTEASQQGGDSHVQSRILVLGSYSFVLRVFLRVSQFSETGSTLTTNSEWLTSVGEDDLLDFSHVGKLYENLVVLVPQKNGSQALWSVSHVMGGRTLQFVTSLSCAVAPPPIRDRLFPALSEVLTGRTLKIVVKEWNNMLSSTRVNGQTVYHGLVRDILHELSHRLQFRCTLIPSPGDSWGQRLDNGQWDGPIGMLMRKEADLAAGYFTITAERSSVADPTTPFTFDNSVIVFRKNAVTKGNNWIFFLQPFDTQVYVLIVACFAAVLLVLLMLETSCLILGGRLKNSCGMRATVQHLVAMHFEVLLAGLLNRPSERKTSSMPARVLVLSWLFLGVMVASLYSSKLTSSLTVADHTLPFTSLNQLIAQDVYSWGFTSGTSQHSLLKASKVREYQTYYQKALQFAEHDPEVLSSDVEVQRAKVLHENYAVFLGSRSTAESWLSESCGLAFLPEPFRTSAFGFYLQKNSPYTKLMSMEITRMMDAGLIDYWRRKWSTGPRMCDPEVTQSGRVIELKDTQTAFYMAAVGIGLAAVVLGIEKWCMARSM